MTNIEIQTMSLIQEACRKYIRKSGERDSQRVYEVAKDLFSAIPIANNDKMTGDLALRCIKAAQVFVPVLNDMEKKDGQ